jgi:DNA polymerase-3 subunit epsilon
MCRPASVPRICEPDDPNAGQGRRDPWPFRCLPQADKPLFDAVAEKWVDFIGDARLVAHNAMFDFGFVNAELERCGLATMSFERMIDTVAIARRKFPGSDNSLDALCGASESIFRAREKHNALLDTQLLAEVYVELIGARQKAMSFGDSERRQTIAATSVPPRPSAASQPPHRR